MGEDDRVVARVTMSGTNSGDYRGLPAPTQQHFESEAIAIVRIADGRVAEIRGTADRLGMLTQLEILPDIGIQRSQGPLAFRMRSLRVCRADQRPYLRTNATARRSLALPVPISRAGRVEDSSGPPDRLGNATQASWTPWRRAHGPDHRADPEATSRMRLALPQASLRRRRRLVEAGLTRRCEQCG
jgi:SnoaL-like polyketide cyclase